MAIRILKTHSDWLSVGTQIDLQVMKSYLDTLGTQLNQMGEDFTKAVESEAQKIEDENERAEFYEWHSDEHWQYKEKFPQILLNSFFVATHSIFESQMDGIAKGIKRKKKQEFGLSDIKRGDYLRCAKEYIRRLTGIDISHSNVWSKLKDYQQIRNIIVHENGKLITETDKSLAKRNGIYDDSNREILLTYEYSREFLNNLGGFFEYLYSELKIGKHM